MLETRSSEKRDVHPSHRGSDSASPPADLGLRCPVCEYNLTGVVEDRCPECGKTFDRGQLIAALAGAPSPIPIWDDASRNVLLRFVHICLLTWFRPTRFAAMLPKRPSPASVRRFSWPATGLALAAGGLLLASNAALTVAAGVFVVVGVPWVVGVVLTELVLAAVYAGHSNHALATPLTDDPTFAWWQGLFGLFRSYMLLQFICTAVAVAVEAGGLGPRLFFTLLAIPVVWWWLSICAVLMRRPTPLLDRLTTILVSPFFIGAAGTVAVVIGFLLGLLCSGLLEF